MPRHQMALRCGRQEEGEEGREDVHREVRKASENSYPLLALKN